MSERGPVIASVERPLSYSHYFHIGSIVSVCVFEYRPLASYSVGGARQGKQPANGCHLPSVGLFALARQASTDSSSWSRVTGFVI